VGLIGTFGGKTKEFICQDLTIDAYECDSSIFFPDYREWGDQVLHVFLLWHDCFHFTCVVCNMPIANYMCTHIVLKLAHCEFAVNGELKTRELLKFLGV